MPDAADVHVHPGRPGRGTFAALAAGCAFFLAYGGLVPFEFHAMSYEEIRSRLLAMFRWPLFIDSRADFATNILLAVPLGYFTIAAFATDRGGWLRRFPAAVLAIVCCVALSIAVEGAQIFFPDRTDSLSDIVAQAAGACAGVVFWLVLGDLVTAWLRDALRERDRPAMAQRFLMAYGLLFVASQVMPLDLTVNLGELADKYRAGGVLIRPFSYDYGSTIDMMWDLAGDLVLNAPLGAAAVLLWTRGQARRSMPLAIVAAIGVVCAIELAQLFVNSRIADTTDVITGSTGAVVGVVLATVFSKRALAPREPLSANRVFVGAGVVVWVLALISYHWNPFDFTVEPGRLREGLYQLLSVPLHSYYAGSELNAFSQVVRKSMLAVPLGILLRLSWPRPRARSGMRFIASALFGFAVLAAIELGQVFLPTRVPDVTDPLVGGLGVVAAIWLTDRLVRADPHQLSDVEPARIEHIRQ